MSSKNYKNIINHVHSFEIKQAETYNKNLYKDNQYIFTNKKEELFKTFHQKLLKGKSPPYIYKKKIPEKYKSQTFHKKKFFNEASNLPIENDKIKPNVRNKGNIIPPKKGKIYIETVKIEVFGKPEKYNYFNQNNNNNVNQKRYDKYLRMIKWNNENCCSSTESLFILGEKTNQNYIFRNVRII